MDATRLFPPESWIRAERDTRGLQASTFTAASWAIYLAFATTFVGILLVRVHGDVPRMAGVAWMGATGTSLLALIMAGVAHDRAMALFLRLLRADNLPTDLDRRWEERERVGLKASTSLRRIRVLHSIAWALVMAGIIPLAVAVTMLVA